uniref:Uncharacterized protein n=1 Tax=Myotis myotis TaxID=51298 RepID=A0A7J7UD28_MYOMY|nr:hypothetical protein mMyoMyo1_008786 [Myotis myotis]
MGELGRSTSGEDPGCGCRQAECRSEGSSRKVKQLKIFKRTYSYIPLRGTWTLASTVDPFIATEFRRKLHVCPARNKLFGLISVTKTTARMPGPCWFFRELVPDKSFTEKVATPSRLVHVPFLKFLPSIWRTFKQDQVYK